MQNPHANPAPPQFFCGLYVASFGFMPPMLQLNPRSWADTVRLGLQFNLVSWAVADIAVMPFRAVLAYSGYRGVVSV